MQYITLNSDELFLEYLHYDVNTTLPFVFPNNIQIGSCKIYFQPVSSLVGKDITEKSASYTANVGADGILGYELQFTDTFLKAGRWKMWTKVVWLEGTEGRSRETIPQIFEVLKSGQVPR
jgi:hypothetical protein